MPPVNPGSEQWLTQMFANIRLQIKALSSSKLTFRTSDVCFTSPTGHR